MHQLRVSAHPLGDLFEAKRLQDHNLALQVPRDVATEQQRSSLHHGSHLVDAQGQQVLQPRLHVLYRVVDERRVPPDRVGNARHSDALQKAQACVQCRWLWQRALGIL